MAKEKYIIKASVNQVIDSVNNFREQKVLKYFEDGETPKEWVEMDHFDNYEDAQEALYLMAKSEVGAVEKDYDFILSEVQNSDDLMDIKDTIEKYFEDGDGVYINDRFAMAENDDSYTDDYGVAYSVEFVEAPKKAFLVTASVCTRVVVNEDASDEEIMDLAKARLLNNLNSDYYDNIEDIIEDNECPYGTFESDKK